MSDEICKVCGVPHTNKPHEKFVMTEEFQESIWWEHASLEEKVEHLYKLSKETKCQ